MIKIKRICLVFFSTFLFYLTGINAQYLRLSQETFYSDDSNRKEEGYCIINTNDENLLLVGDDHPNPINDESIIRKVDYDGNVIWTTILSDPLFNSPDEIDVAAMAIELIDSYVILVSAGGSDYGLFKIEKGAGIIQDARKVAEPINLRTKALFAISDTEFTVGTDNGKIQTYDRFLNPVTSKTYGNNNPFPGFLWGSNFIDIERLQDGSLLFVGQIDDGFQPCECDLPTFQQSSNSGVLEPDGDIWILKMNATLSSPIFSQAIGSEATDIPFDATYSPDNGFVIIGRSWTCPVGVDPPGCTYQSIGPGNIGDGHTWVWKLDQNGNQDANIFPFFFFDGNERARGRHIMYEPGCQNYYITGIGDPNSSFGNPFGYIQRLDDQLNILEDGFSFSGDGETEFSHSVFAGNHIFSVGIKEESAISAPVSPPHTDGEDMVMTKFISSGQFPKPENLAITDFNITTSNLTVSNISGNIQDITLFINLTHTYIGDLVIELSSPSGTVTEIFDRFCGTDEDILYCFNDSGEMQPTCPYDNFPLLPNIAAKPLDLFAIYDGENPNGVWTLTISDNASGDQGQLLYWSLDIDNDFCSSNCPPNFAGPNMLSGTQSINADFETDGIIQSTQIIDANVDYDSGIHIDLLAGFEVKIGKLFHAFVDGCGNLFREEENTSTKKN